MDALAVLTASLKATGKSSSPGYHYDMMHDLERNEAYAVAIEQQGPGDLTDLTDRVGHDVVHLLRAASHPRR